MYDAVELFVKAIKALDNSTDVQISELVCQGEDAWVHGNSLINFMKLVSIHSINYFTADNRYFNSEDFDNDFHCNITVKSTGK